MKIKYEADVECGAGCKFHEFLNPANGKHKRCCNYDHHFCSIDKSLLEKRECPIEVKDDLPKVP